MRVEAYIRSLKDTRHDRHVLGQVNERRENHEVF